MTALKNISSTENLKAVSKFAKLKKISRQFAYELIEKQEIDHTVIDGVTFIVMNDKAKNYIKNR